MLHPIKKISYKHIDTLILFGGSFLMARLLEELLKGKFGYKIVLFTALRHLDGVINEKGTTLRAFLENRKISFFEAEDINNHAHLAENVTPNSLGLALGAAWPVVLGGAVSFHKGPILKNLRYAIPRAVSQPIDYFNVCLEREITFLVSFFTEVKKGKTFTSRALDENRSSWYPFLSTPHQGLIDWSWSGSDIALFIGAFGEPYKGASTYLGEKRVFLKGCSILKAEEKYHPFTAGIVIRKNGEGIFVATKGALLLIARVLDENGNDIGSEVFAGSRLYTPSSELDKAMGFNAEYGASGLKK